MEKKLEQIASKAKTPPDTQIGLDAQALREGQILRDIYFEGIEQDNHRQVVYFKNFNDSSLKVIAYPQDEIVALTRPYDVIIRRLVEKERKPQNILLALSEIYHDFTGREEIDIVVSGISSRGQPMFQLCGYLGFILPERGIHQGDWLKVGIRRIKPTSKGQIIEAFLITYLKPRQE